RGQAPGGRGGAGRPGSPRPGAIRRPAVRAGRGPVAGPASHASRVPRGAKPPRIPPMRRRFRSATLPVHRHSLLQLLVDGALVALAYYLAFQLRFDNAIPTRYEELLERTIPWVVPLYLVVLAALGAYQRLWKFVGQREYEAVVKGAIVA